MELQEILKQINHYNPSRITIEQEKNNITLGFEANKYIVYLYFNEKGKSKIYCYINYLGNYFFSIKDEAKIIFEYLYLILNKDNSNNKIELTK